MRIQGTLVCVMLLAGCGGRTVESDAPPQSHFPLGTYSDCAEGRRSDGGLFLGSSGFSPDATLDVSAGLVATFADQSGATSSFDFTTTSNASAALTKPAQVTTGFTAFCVHGVGVSNEELLPGTLTAGAGSLANVSGSLFLSLAGELHADLGSCGEASASGDYWVVCRNGPTGAPAGAPSKAFALSGGTFACTSQIATYYESGGLKQYVASGGDGTLSLSQSDGQLSAEYDGDSFIAGSWTLSATSETTANIALDQSATLSCEVPIGFGGIPAPKPVPMPISAAALMVDGDALVLSLTGSMGETTDCPGANKVATLVCSNQ